MDFRRSYRMSGQRERASLGLALKLMRIRAGLTQEELGRRVGKKHSYISRIEAGDQAIDVVALLELIRAGDGDPNEILDDLVEMFRQGP